MDKGEKSKTCKHARMSLHASDLNHAPHACSTVDATNPTHHVCFILFFFVLYSTWVVLDLLPAQTFCLFSEVHPIRGLPSHSRSSSQDKPSIRILKSSHTSGSSTVPGDPMQHPVLKTQRHQEDRIEVKSVYVALNS